MLVTPGHGSLPSGHSTEAHIVAYVLWKLLREARAQDLPWLEEIMRQAAGVAINRTVAGFHFPVDSAAGQLLGLTLGEYLVHRCGGATHYSAWRFDGERYGKADDFTWSEQYDTASDAHTAAGFTDLVDASLATTSPAAGYDALGWLWKHALAEWT